jgi:UDP-N-acetylmuramate--alanine ligase
MEGITSKTITDKMKNPAHGILSKDGLINYIRNHPPALLITAGAGDIDQLVEPIKKIMAAQ